MTGGQVRSRPFDYPASGRARTGTLYEAAADRAVGESGSAPRPFVVVIHGLFADRRLPEIERVCRLLAECFDVVSIDMRGHGQGPGVFTWGREEHRDLADLVVFLRTFGPAVGVLGFSFGGDVAIFSAAMSRGREETARPDAICTVGAPAHMDVWRFRIGLKGMPAHVRMLVMRRRRRFIPGWPRLRWRRAVDLVSGVSPVPLLILHGGSDWLVHPSHAQRLYEAAGPPKELRIIPNGMHAEYMIAQDPDMVVLPARSFFQRWLWPPRPERLPGAGGGEVTMARDRS